jgi:hypothetical protein
MKLTLPKTEPGIEANLAQIKIALPKQLPSRLTTLQHACLQATFNANPAACPVASVVGAATARTPTLPGQLSGPVYFVTRGPQALPSPIVVLQDSGVTLELHGSSTINKAGTASVAFDQIPDVPMESLELNLSQGPHSLLTTSTRLCTQGKAVTTKHEITKYADGRKIEHTPTLLERPSASLPMATEFVAHNGAVIRRTTRIEVAGCAARQAMVARRPPPYERLSKYVRRSVARAVSAA